MLVRIPSKRGHTFVLNTKPLHVGATSGVGDEGPHLWSDRVLQVRVQEELQVVPHDRSGERDAVLGARKTPHWGARGIGSYQRVVLKESKRAAMPGIGSRTGHDVDGTAGKVAVTNVDRGGEYLHLCHRLGGDRVRQPNPRNRAPNVEIGVLAPIDQVAGVTRILSADHEFAVRGTARLRAHQCEVDHFPDKLGN